MSPPPVLGDGDEPLGGGVPLGDIGGSVVDLGSLTGDVQAGAGTTTGFLRRNFLGSGDEPASAAAEAARNAKKRRDDEALFQRRQRERKRREVEERRIATVARQAAEVEARIASLTSIAHHLNAAHQAQLVKDEQDIVQILLLAA